MSEGSLKAPIRHPVPWQDPDFTDPQAIDEELRRVFDICHGCRRCFNLCDSFPKLFDLVDAAPTGELDSVNSEDFAPVVDACTLCDMCFMTKCPYVPPHEFNIDFPHLMLRYRAMQREQEQLSKVTEQMVQVDRNAKLAAPVAGIINWATNSKNKLTRQVIAKVADIHPKAEIPKFHSQTLVKTCQDHPLTLNKAAPGYGRKVALYATCYGNYHNPNIGLAARAILAHNGVEAEVVYPGCCGMPNLEQGDIARVAKQAQIVTAELLPWVEKGYDVVALVPSCALMLKFEWPLLVSDPQVKKLSQHTFDICQYLVSLSKDCGLTEGLRPLAEHVTLHIACHARAQNMGHKAAELLRLVPNTDVKVIERCSGHGGTWGMMVDNFEVALKVGKPVAKQALQNKNHIVSSECPLAATHIHQAMAAIDPEQALNYTNLHPLEIFAQAYGL